MIPVKVLHGVPGGRGSLKGAGMRTRVNGRTLVLFDTPGRWPVGYGPLLLPMHRDRHGGSQGPADTEVPRERGLKSFAGTGRRGGSQGPGLLLDCVSGWSPGSGEQAESKGSGMGAAGEEMAADDGEAGAGDGPAPMDI